MKQKLLKFIGLGVILALLMAFVVSRGWFSGLQRNLQNHFYDYDNASSEIVIAAIDEKSLSEDRLGGFNQWKRAYYAQAIEVLNDESAAAIGIDITFPDKSLHGPSDDLALQNALESHDNVVLAGRYFFENGERKVELPNETLREANPDIGWINVNLDPDGFVRTIPLFAQADGKTLEAFSLQVARIYQNLDPVGYRILDNTFRFSTNTSIPTISKTDPSNGQQVHFMYINYFAEPNRFTHISFSDLLEGKLVDKQGNPIDFTDKIVLIGPTAIDIKDHYLSPVSEAVKMAGVEIHANNIQTIFQKQFLRDQSMLSFWVTLLAIIVVNLLLFSRLRVRFAIPLTLLEIFAIVVAGIVAYENRIFLNVIYPILLILLTFVGTYLLRFILEQKNRKFIQNAFGHYVNAEVVEKILKDPHALELGGQKKEISVYFSDIAGFTSVSETLDPSELVKLLNEYLQVMTNTILDEHGTLDKYEGDAVMAFWNAPLEVPEHAKRVCRAALENQRKMGDLRKKWKSEGKPEMRMRIGINTGQAVAGNMGSEDRFDYTVMGDDVNLASRLEGINKQYGTEIMVSEATYEKVKDDFVFRELDRIRVKGKQEPVQVFELIGTKDNVSQVKLDAIKNFEEALKLYRDMQFEAAKAKFESLHGDPAADVFAQRCETFMKQPPEAGWDGVFTFTTK